MVGVPVQGGSGGVVRTTVVIPTYNRPEKLRSLLMKLMRAEGVDGAPVEVLVVDDGSAPPAESVVASFVPPRGISLRCIRQENSGPGPARNRGLREATGELILFLDDDLLPPPGLIKAHREAHLKRPRSVIYGRTPWITPDVPTPLSRFLTTYVWPDHLADDSEEFQPGGVCSGNISFLRSEFPSWHSLYANSRGGDDPELMIRLAKEGVPLLLATRIVVPQDQTLTLQAQCSRIRFHAHGLGHMGLNFWGGEVPERFVAILAANGPIQAGDSPSRIIRKLALASIVRFGLLDKAESIGGFVERLGLPERALHACYRLLIESAYFAGIRDAYREAAAAGTGAIAAGSSTL